MRNYGFVKVCAASPKLKVADCDFNTTEMTNIISDVAKEEVSAVVFPEMSLTAYTAQDLFNQRLLLKKAIDSLADIVEVTQSHQTIVIIGMPFEIGTHLYNVAVAIHKGRILGIVPKTFLPNYNEFYDKRWFSSPRSLKQASVRILNQDVPVGTDLIFETDSFRFGIEICEDLWTSIPPSSIQSLYGADVIFNLSASPETVGKHAYRKDLVAHQSARCIAGYVYASAGNGESTTDLVFSGSSLIAENGSVLAETERFSFDSKYCTAYIDIDKLRNDRLKNTSFSTAMYESMDDLKFRTIYIDQDVNEDKFLLDKFINPTPFVPSDDDLDDKCSEIFAIQVAGLAKRLSHTNVQSSVIGISGGLDSTLALLVTVKAYDKLKISRTNIYGITMPGFGTTDRTYNNALTLMKSLGITIREISIRESVIQHFKDIDQDPNVHDITYENSQARERTQILMDYANKVNGLVIGTGDLSELALGWCTYNGDHMSMYAVNSGVPKTLVKTLVKWISHHQVEQQSKAVLLDILDTPVSPELLPADKDGKILQITEDSVGPYILHDFFLYNMLRFGYEPAKIYFLAQHAFKNKYKNEEILKWLKVFYRRFFSQQFKRSCIPDGPKVGSINLSPRGDWRMASDASSALWLKQLDAMQ